MVSFFMYTYIMFLREDNLTIQILWALSCNTILFMHAPHTSLVNSTSIFIPIKIAHEFSVLITI
jgi:hypothetical protein